MNPSRRIDGFKVFIAVLVFTFGCYHFLLWRQKGFVLGTSFYANEDVKYTQDFRFSNSIRRGGDQYP